MFYFFFFPETLQSTIRDVKLSKTTVENYVTVTDLWFLATVYMGHQIAILLESASWVSNAICWTFFLFLFYFLWTTVTKIFQLFDMIAKFSEAGITLGCCSEKDE